MRGHRNLKASFDKLVNADRLKKCPQNAHDVGFSLELHNFILG